VAFILSGVPIMFTSPLPTMASSNVKRIASVALFHTLP
jgi:hypothetical protein